jgi:cell division inhibitor SulA
VMTTRIPLAHLDQRLAPLLKHPKLRLGNQEIDRCPGVATGFPALDSTLGGWPRGALTEIYVHRPGVGELSLLMPTLSRLSQSGTHSLCVAPPYLPYAPALVQQGLDLTRLWIVLARERDALWALEQALRSGVCGAVMAWLQATEERALRRLQLAAAAGQACCFLFRPAAAALLPSPAQLRLWILVRMTPAGRELQVRVFKHHRGWGELLLPITQRPSAAGEAQYRSRAGWSGDDLVESLVSLYLDSCLPLRQNPWLITGRAVGKPFVS